MSPTMGRRGGLCGSVGFLDSILREQRFPFGPGEKAIPTTWSSDRNSEPAINSVEIPNFQ